MNLTLFHAHFAFSAKTGKSKTYSENYYKRLISIVEGVDKLQFDKNIYHMYRKKFVQFGNDGKYSEGEI